jgi:hypothetical protein
VLGQQRLVGGHHGLAGGERAGEQPLGRLDAADHLDHDVDVVAGDERGGVRGQQLGRDLRVLVQPAHRDAAHPHRRADPRGQVAGLLVEQPGHL